MCDPITCLGLNAGLVYGHRRPAGPALSRLDRLLAIGPRATPTNLHKLTLSIEAAYVVPARGPHAVFFKGEIYCQQKPN